MSEYIKDETLPCPACASEGQKTNMEMETDHGSIIWVCPIHGTNWNRLDFQLKAPRGRNQHYRIVRRRLR
jgi:hypothetical protein